MIRNYNGDINRTILRNLKKICDVCDENFENLLERYMLDGKVSFYTNLCPFTGTPDFASKGRTLKSYGEIEAFIKTDLHNRLNMFLDCQTVWYEPEHNGDFLNDYLFSEVYEFILDHARYPNKEEMRELEYVAELKRILASPEEEIQKKPITEKDIVKEILELSEEIIESRRETKPRDIWVHVEPYPDDLEIDSENFGAVFKYNRYDACGNSTDYYLDVFFKDHMYSTRKVYRVDFRCYTEGRYEIFAQNCNDLELDLPKEKLIMVHKGIVEMAIAEGIEFLSEVDYQAFEQSPNSISR